MSTHGYQRLSDADLWAQAGSASIRMHRETDLRRPTRLAERLIGAQMLHQLQEGDTLVVGSLADLCDLPSDATKMVRVLAGRGVKLEVLAGVDLFTAAGAFEGLERELIRVQAELATVQEIADQRVDHARKEIMARMIEIYGPPDSWSAGMPQGAGDVFKPLSAGTMGDALRARREAMGLSQSKLAEAAGVSQTTVSRAETNQLTPPEALLTFLFAAPAPHTSSETSA